MLLGATPSPPPALPVVLVQWSTPWAWACDGRLVQLAFPVPVGPARQLIGAMHPAKGCLSASPRQGALGSIYSSAERSGTHPSPFHCATRHLSSTPLLCHNHTTTNQKKQKTNPQVDEGPSLDKTPPREEAHWELPKKS